MYLSHNNVLQISGSMKNAKTDLREILSFFNFVEPDSFRIAGWRIDGEGRLAFKYKPAYLKGDGPAEGWFSADQLSSYGVIRKIEDYLAECAERFPGLRNSNFLLRWIPQGGYDRVNRICGEVDPETYGWDGGFTVEPWDGWKGRIFRFSYDLAADDEMYDKILAFAQRYLNLVFNGEIYPLPDGGFALGRYSREELQNKPILINNKPALETIALHMKQLLPEQQVINGTYCDEESRGFVLNYVSGQMEGQDKLLVLPYVCFSHK